MPSILFYYSTWKIFVQKLKLKVFFNLRRNFEKEGTLNAVRPSKQYQTRYVFLSVKGPMMLHIIAYILRVLAFNLCTETN